jgi:signal peptidase I
LSISSKTNVKPFWRECLETIAIALVLSFFIITFIMQTHIVDGESMLNTLVHGQRLIVEKVSYRFVEPKRGDIIVFRYPQNPKERYVKRVIGVPGDEIYIHNNVVYVNDVPINEPYVDIPASGNYYPVTVKEDHVYVLGDNRINSLDSRSPLVGQVPYDLIIGKAVLSFWPLNRLGIFTNPFNNQTGTE